MDIDANLVYSRTEYDVTSHLRSAFLKVWKKAANVALDGFLLNFCGTAFCLPHQLVGVFFKGGIWLLHFLFCKLLDIFFCLGLAIFIAQMIYIGCFKIILNK